MPAESLPRERLSLELEHAALRAVAEEYENLNWSLFRNALRRPNLCWVDGATGLGCFRRDPRRLELNRTLLLHHGWGVLTEVLKHEMAHQFVCEALGCEDEPDHGPLFRKVCEDRGIDARASGLPEAVDTQSTQARVLDRIAKLLALAESPNLHEAQAAMSAAQRLMLKYNIEAALQPTTGRHVFRHLGVPTGRRNEIQQRVAGILNEHFFVQVIWVSVWRPLKAKRESVLEVCGTPENVELAAYVHDFLMHTAEQLWVSYRRNQNLKGNAQRRQFIAGVMAGFASKLDAERKQNSGRGLIWTGDLELERYFRARHPRIRRTTTSAKVPNFAYAHGQEAGRRLVLHRGLRQTPSGEVRMLTDGSRK